MAEWYLRSLDPSLQVASAGTHPAATVHRRAVAVMKEIDIDMSSATTKTVDQFLGEEFDYVVTVCDHARESCPVFTGKVRRRLHMGFDDPAAATGSDEEVMNEFRRIRDEICGRFSDFYRHSIRAANT